MSAIHTHQSLPLSPSSPPESGLKRQKRRLSDDNLPDSPNSPPLMPVTASDYVSQYGEARSGASQAQPQEGSTDMQRQQSANALPTPANSVAGSMKAGEAEDADQHRDKRQRLDTEEREASHQTIPGLSIQPTNHERQKGESSTTPVRSSTEIEGAAGFGLFLPKTKLPRVTRLQPDPNEHLMSLYGLNPILKNVARIDPTSGEKINPMRKSYENQINVFELAGRNKPVKKELQPPFNPGRLMSKYRTQPQSEGFEISAEMKAKLNTAMQMQPGRVNNLGDWERSLGLDKPKVVPPAPVQTVQTAAPLRANGAVRVQAAKPQYEPIRARRNKRRTYDDSSFEGYGGGYVDEDITDSDDDGGSAKRKRRKTDNDEY